MPTAELSVRKISKNLLEEIKRALRATGGWGSVEIFVQNGEVTQITNRKIKKLVGNGSNGKHRD